MSPLNKNSLFTRIKLMETFDSAGEVGGSDNARSPTGHCDFSLLHNTKQSKQIEISFMAKTLAWELVADQYRSQRRCHVPMQISQENLMEDNCKRNSKSTPNWGRLTFRIAIFKWACKCLSVTWNILLVNKCNLQQTLKWETLLLNAFSYQTWLDGQWQHLNRCYTLCWKDISNTGFDKLSWSDEKKKKNTARKETKPKENRAKRKYWISTTVVPDFPLCRYLGDRT